MKNTYRYSIYQKRIYGLACQYMANREDAEDVVQEVPAPPVEPSLLPYQRRAGGLDRAGDAQRLFGRLALRRRNNYRSAVGTQAGEAAVQNAPVVETNLLQHLGIEEALSRLAEPYRFYFFIFFVTFS